ncbi:transposable element Tcb2 transposase, partial [Trichonephila clavipes]
QDEQLSQYERWRIIGLREAGWSAMRVTRQFGLCDCVVRKCWEHWIQDMSYTRKLASGCHRQTSRREDRHIIRTARVQSPPSRHSDESGFKLSSDDNHVREWLALSECLNLASALQRYTAPVADVIVRGAIAYNTRSPLVLIRGT